ncbi:hypothetical protein QBC39DRAFT_254628 [Podospora conica]|nr:hypothetical protein QBC39DRAFT_254628 [Schizothecium conicum]
MVLEKFGTVAAHRLAPAWPRIRRCTSARQTVVLLVLAFVSWLVFLQLSIFSSEWTSPLGLIGVPGYSHATRRMTSAYNTLPPLDPPIPCYGARGKLLSDSYDDRMEETRLDIPYPIPFTGSYEAVGLDMTWTTAEERYAAYGYGEKRESYNRTKVQWDTVDWGALQNECFERNEQRFPSAAKKFDDPLDVLRLGFRNRTRIPEVRHWHEFNQTRRTALVVRSWRGYNFQPEDMYYLRSLITETSLHSGGEYQVILLVDMRESPENIFASKDAYEKGLHAAGIPAEFRSIAVLWDEHLLKSWYRDIDEHRTMWQVYQPMQLLALHYPEFDHFWQLELDMRFTGHAGRYLSALAASARSEPRKQALERSTFMHMQSRVPSALAFHAAVNTTCAGSSFAWGPVRVPELAPIGPAPPVADPVRENFEWGVGEDADVIVTSFCNNASAADSWVFRDWIGGLRAGIQTPRFFCPPAVTRTSRALMLVAHQAQVERAVRVPSEATPPSFAVWHGLKLSFPQGPVFFRREEDDEYVEGWWKGGPAAGRKGGLGPVSLEHPSGDGLSFWWGGDWPRKIYDAWQGYEDLGKDDRGAEEKWPWVLRREGGTVYAPNMMVHPMKRREGEPPGSKA